MSQNTELDKSGNNHGNGSVKNRESIGQSIGQNLIDNIPSPEESASQLKRLIVYWDLKDPQRASKYGQLPADYLLVYPIQKEEVNDEKLHPLLFEMKDRMHRLCAEKLGFDHAVSFNPICYYHAEEALLVKVEPEKHIIYQST